MQRLHHARRQTDLLFEMIRPSALYERPIPERHRVIFYLGHLEAFDWNLLGGGQKSSHPTFDQLFAFGIDPVGGNLPDDQPQDWPSESEVQAYCGRIRMALNPVNHPQHLLHVAIEHRLMHAETLAYMLHQLPFGAKIPPADRRLTEVLPPNPSPFESGMVEIPGGPATMGLSEPGAFGWDNEFDAHTVHVEAFAIDRYKVTNAQYLEFVRAGGRPPVFWRRNGDHWLYQTMFEEIPLPLHWPVYVSHADASAYARWAGKALPTEAQWQRAAEGSELTGNFGFKRWNPTHVAASPESTSMFGAVEMRGNGWEWTSSLFGPFPGFTKFPFYPGYSANFFDGQHYVMKGGSARTAACMMRPSFRNWFQPDYPYVYAGFRCVDQSAAAQDGSAKKR
jgi:iron(II)-dependent oxidoreductase